ncbi:MAG TPA: 1-acyl-sn-glycerol-3-phosphate acyltransferase [Ruminococcaceae bacterium]|jgi:1-acyl-sn-glycerol-3-phosphate acyltransferase|nr:1-acyl-sn-glycerol-3-phosphate acyltransferase [Oscillospiraceae bacterium]HCC01926.1 1-acyl-sn-glycerol-3-phosphate acyltransferase [Oscillospiraceae bacterium]HCM24389.1 1-acyl-sn-glycerol-3-phosphate acyltransferase [Oscillospiraceae bacterium]
MEMTPLYRFAKIVPQWFVRPILPVRIRGTENLPKKGAAIVCFNHMRNSDPVRIFFTSHRQIFFLGKSELFQNKFISWVLRNVGVISIQRGRGDVNAMSDAGKHLKNGNLLGVFIEGTRSRDGSFGKPKAGVAMLAWRYHVPVIPCCLTAKDGKLPKVFHPCCVSYGKPIQPEELGLVTGKSNELRAASRTIMQKIQEIRAEDLRALPQ